MTLESLLSELIAAGKLVSSEETVNGRWVRMIRLRRQI